MFFYARSKKVEVETAILKGDFLSRTELENVFSQIADAMLVVIKGSKLSAEEQADLRRTLAAIPVVIEGVGRTGCNGAGGADNGAPKKRRGRPPKPSLREKRPRPTQTR